MFLILLIMQIPDTLDIDTIGVIDDTVIVLKTYEIPEIITYDQTNSDIQSSFLALPAIIPDYTDITLGDAFFSSPYTVIDQGAALPAHLTIQDTDSKHAYLYFNNHLLNDPINGTINLALVPIQFIESIETGVNGYGIPAIDINPEINRYDRPYSSTGFMTGSFGHTAYIFELTRAIDNSSGFYLDGLHRKTDGYRSNDRLTANAVYANVYDNHLLPMRMDALFSSNTFGFPDLVYDTISTMDQRMIDISYAAGVTGHSAFVYFNDYSDWWHDSLNQRTVKHRARTYGLGSDNYHRVGPIQILYQIAGMRHNITSDVYGSHTIHSLAGAHTLNATYGKYFASVSIHAAIDPDMFNYAPFLAIGMAITDSLVAFASIARPYRSPLIAETAPLIDSTVGVVATNESLRSESYWNQELGVRARYGALVLFHHDFTDRIMIVTDSLQRPVYTNGSPWQNSGIQGAMTFPLYLRWSQDTTTYACFAIGAYGSYLFNEDTSMIIPRYSLSGRAAFSLQTERFGFTLAGHSFSVGNRSVHSQLLDPYTITGFSAVVRFIRLYIAVRVDNVFDLNYRFYPDYPLAPRSFTVNLYWQFWY